MVSAIVVVAPGNEEMEAVITIDVLRRAHFKVVVAGLESKEPTKFSRGVVITPDATLAELDSNSFDIIILPGGMPGAISFSESTILHEILKEFESNANKWIGAICAGNRIIDLAPIALHAAQIGFGKKITSHPSVKERLHSDYKYSEKRVVVSEQLITSRGPGTSFEFALEIIKQLESAQTAVDVSGPMLLPES
ncbi:Protein deglycase DJ-1zDJ-1 [Terramyces sp. JEL0728]|nr:Protein deglycase DJ-1zDJ-1 [Terramyces sp. JEL0728]